MQIDVNGIKITLTDQQLREIADQQKKLKTKEEMFLELISGIDVNQPMVDFEKYPNFLFWFDKDGKYICEYDWKNGHFWFSYRNVWSVFESEFSLNYLETKKFLNGMVEEHFKLKGVTTGLLYNHRITWVEEHFKLKN